MRTYMLELTMRLSGEYVFKRPVKGHVPSYSSFLNGLVDENLWLGSSDMFTNSTG